MGITKDGAACGGLFVSEAVVSAGRLKGSFKDELLRALWQDPNYEVHQMSCEEITIEAVDPGVHARLLSAATVAGAQFDGTKATIHGLEFDWSYDAETQTLHVTCTKKPFWANCGEVESKVRELVKNAKGGI
jgi:hypothetical protein